jgi:hypothetical protein
VRELECLSEPGIDGDAVTLEQQHPSRSRVREGQGGEVERFEVLDGLGAEHEATGFELARR